MIILDSSMVEHSAVNRRVVGSSPTRGVNELSRQVGAAAFFSEKYEKISFIMKDVFCF